MTIKADLTLNSDTDQIEYRGSPVAWLYQAKNGWWYPCMIGADGEASTQGPRGVGTMPGDNTKEEAFAYYVSAVEAEPGLFDFVPS